MLGLGFREFYTTRVKISLEEMKKKVVSNTQKLTLQNFHPTYQYDRYKDGSVMTVCMIENEKREQIAVGFSVCSSEDNFCRVEGRYYSLNRAIASLNAKRNLFPVINHNRKNKAMINFGKHKFWAEYKVLKLDN